MRATRNRVLRLGVGVGLLIVMTLVLGPVIAADTKEDARARLLRLNQVTGNDAMAGSILELIKDEAGTKKLLSLARDLIKKNDETLNSNATLILARAAQGLKDYDTSEVFYRLNIDQARKLESGQRLILAYNGLVGILIEAKRYDEAEKAFKAFQELEIGDNVDRFRESLRRRMALQLARQGQLDKASELVDKLLQDDPNNPLNQELKGRILHEGGKLEDAAATYEKLVENVLGNQRLPKDLREEFANDIRYRLSGVYVDLKRIDKAGDTLKALLEKDPDNPTYNNDLGFIWADHDLNLDEAEKLVRKAIEKERDQRKKLANPKAEPVKDNPAYLDSLGWVLFKKKKYAEAKKHLQEAVAQEEGRHLEIYDHLGDCLLKLGEKKEAVAAWKKGLESASDSRRDKIRKVNVQQKIKDAEK